MLSCMEMELKRGIVMPSCKSALLMGWLWVVFRKERDHRIGQSSEQDNNNDKRHRIGPT